MAFLLLLHSPVVLEWIGPVNYNRPDDDLMIDYYFMRLTLIILMADDDA